MGFSVAPQFFAMKTQRYFHEYGIPLETATSVAERAFHNGSITPHAWRREALSFETIAASPMLCDPLRQFMLTNPCGGGGAVILCRTDVAHRYSAQAIRLRAISIKTRGVDTFEVGAPSISNDLQPGPSVMASREAFEMAGVGPADMDVIQLQDTDSGTEVIHYDECGFCEPGEQAHLVTSGATAIDGRLPINTDGGLLANGEPVGASGLRQVYEIVQQLRGQAGQRQVPGNPRFGFTHVYGGPGVSAVTILER
jgi:acetyl-CoA acetyltransferase